ncbi:TetR/AcrR family transcriptional regulator [Prauserella oleivorans]|uniref:TetR/AcrR family transcriptional regulator n=2 Tax=Prauserella oleivorans TaxID=1478153 RepID=A0ABW5WBE4_9PSEU
MRADARRNYERLLVEATDLFARHGVDASLEDVAKAAGVGIGTLYRHFPSRDALIEALLRTRFDSLAATAEHLLRHPSPAEAVRIWARGFAETATTFHGLVRHMAHALKDEGSQLFAACRRSRESAGRLLRRAQESGEYRADLDPDDFVLLVQSVAWASEHTHDDGSLDRLLSLVVDGLRPR